MARRRVLLLMKPFDVYPPRPKAKDPSSFFIQSTVNSKILDHLDDRCRVHNEGINICQDVLRRKSLDWEPLFRNNISQPIRGVDLVVTVGGDGTLLQASHFIDASIPILGVNSDPTQPGEVSISFLDIILIIFLFGRPLNLFVFCLFLAFLVEVGKLQHSSQFLPIFYSLIFIKISLMLCIKRSTNYAMNLMQREALAISVQPPLQILSRF